VLWYACIQDAYPWIKVWVNANGAWTSDQVSKMPGWNPATKYQDIANAQQVIQAIHTPLTVLETHMPTLEDAYLDIVGNGE